MGRLRRHGDPTPWLLTIVWHAYLGRGFGRARYLMDLIYNSEAPSDVLRLRRLPLFFLERGFGRIFWATAGIVPLRQTTREYEPVVARGPRYRSFAEYGGAYHSILMYGEGRTTPDQSQWLGRVHSPQCLEHRIANRRVRVAGMALAKADAGRTLFDVLYVALALFDYCCLPDVGR